MISEKLEKLLIRIESLLLHLIKKRNIVCFEICIYNFCSLSAITYNNIRKRKEMYKEGLNWRFFLFFFFYNAQSLWPTKRRQKNETGSQMEGTSSRKCKEPSARQECCTNTWKIELALRQVMIRNIFFFSTFSQTRSFLASSLIDKEREKISGV